MRFFRDLGITLYGLAVLLAAARLLGCPWGEGGDWALLGLVALSLASFGAHWFTHKEGL